MLALLSGTLALSPAERAIASIWGLKPAAGGKLDAAAARFESLSSEDRSVVFAKVYARQAESAIQAEGVAATRAKNARSGPPWQIVGRVASADTIQRAVHAQRDLLVQSARDQHKPLRFLQSISLAYGAENGDDLTLGSFRCASCGAFNEAQAQQCSNCAAPRDADAPRGSLTLAAAPKRERPLPLEQCGFSPFGGDG